MHPSFRHAVVALVFVGALPGVATVAAQSARAPHPSAEGRVAQRSVRLGGAGGTAAGTTGARAPMREVATGAAPGAASASAFPPGARATLPPATHDGPNWRRPPVAVPPITPPYGPDAVRAEEERRIGAAVLGAFALLSLIWWVGHQ